MRLIFVRHGDPDYQNDCLTDIGRRQATSTAARLHDEKIKAIYASSNGRAIETASYTAKDHGLDVQVLDYMHEIWWGDKDQNIDESQKIPFEGHPWSISYKLLTEHPEYAGDNAWAEHPYFKNDGLNVLLDLPISITEAIKGAKITVPTVNGKVAVKVPPYSSSGDKLRLKGQGIKAKSSQGDEIITLQIMLPKNKSVNLDKLADNLENYAVRSF